MQGAGKVMIARRDHHWEVNGRCWHDGRIGIYQLLAGMLPCFKHSGVSASWTFLACLCYGILEPRFTFCGIPGSEVVRVRVDCTSNGRVTSAKHLTRYGLGVSRSEHLTVFDRHHHFHDPEILIFITMRP